MIPCNSTLHKLVFNSYSFAMKILSIKVSIIQIEIGRKIVRLITMFWNEILCISKIFDWEIFDSYWQQKAHFPSNNKRPELSLWEADLWHHCRFSMLDLQVGSDNWKIIEKYLEIDFTLIKTNNYTYSIKNINVMKNA